MEHIHNICNQYEQIVKGKASLKQGDCSVELERNPNGTIQGRPSRSASRRITRIC
ncbi:hypothetical protein [Psychrobacillus glaciei]|uniref:hypothetical protein n=1 Tax=Psychrobacillus glaciei TaxID=2283160 RepID=UPI001CEF93D7|nr:hypothetical protein [Psychrobacillus glaciei]